MTVTRLQIYLNPNNEQDALLIVFLETHGGKNTSNYIKEVLQQIRTGKLIIPEVEDLQREKMLVDIEYKKIVIKIREQELIYKETFQQNPPPKHKEVMKIHIENQNLTHGVSVIDEKNNRIMCAECGACFVFATDQHDKQESKQKFIEHFVDKHGLVMPPEIQKELNDF